MAAEQLPILSRKPPNFSTSKSNLFQPRTPIPTTVDKFEATFLLSFDGRVDGHMLLLQESWSCTVPELALITVTAVAYHLTDGSGVWYFRI